MKTHIEQAILEYKNEQTNIFIKGWAHCNNYKIVIKTKNKNLFSTQGNESRYDICKNFNEKIKENNYGFKIDIKFKYKIKKIKIYIEYGRTKKLIKKISIGKLSKIINKFKNYIKLFIRAIRFLWREYHFIVPLSMVKKHIKDLKIKIKKLNSQSMDYLNPEIPHDYEKWLKINEKKLLKEKNNNITYLILSKNKKNEDFYKKNYSNNYYIIDNKIEENIKKIKTKYIGIISDECTIDDNLNYYIKTINDNDFIYFDHDYINEQGKRFMPFFKPDWSKDTILGANYIGDFFVINKNLLSKINLRTKDIYNYILDIRDEISNPLHISEILYHQKKYTVDQKNIYNNVTKYIKNNHIDAKVVCNEDKETVSVLYRTKKQPLISIIIPTKDHIDILKNCIESIYDKTTYKNFEIIIIDNNSEKKESINFFKEYQKKYNNLFVYRLECPFNYSYINNVAVNKYSKGDYILLLNNDTEIITNEWLEIMVGYAMQKDIGTVGAKLIFSDNTIQHAGIIMGKGGLAGHAHYGRDRYKYSYQWELKVPYNVSGSTAACLMIEKKKFLEVNGLEEKLMVAFNDVDFNLKILQKGYRNIFLPNVELYHYESKSRGLDNTKEKQKRFMQEWQFMETKWKDTLSKDPFYNNNLSVTYDYMLKNKED